MKKIVAWLKNYLFYTQLLALLTVAAAFIPAFDPIVAYGEEGSRILFSIFADLGGIEKYFESILSITQESSEGIKCS